MAKIKLDLPENFLFSTKIPIRITDINYGGHLGNDSLLSLIHEARVQFLNKYGFSEKEIDGVGLILVDVAIVYKSECFYGDNLLIEVTLDIFSKTRCYFIYKLSNINTNKEVARAKTGIAFYNYKNRRAVAIPQKFYNTFFKPKFCI